MPQYETSGYTNQPLRVNGAVAGGIGGTKEINYRVWLKSKGAYAGVFIRSETAEQKRPELDEKNGTVIRKIVQILHIILTPLEPQSRIGGKLLEV